MEAVDYPIAVVFASCLSFGCGFFSTFGRLVAHCGNSGGFFWRLDDMCT